MLWAFWIMLRASLCTAARCCSACCFTPSTSPCNHPHHPQLMASHVHQKGMLLSSAA